MKFSLGRRRIIFGLVSILVIILIVFWIRYSNSSKPIKHYNFHGTDFEFRGDLRSARNVSVYPNEATILYTMWSPDVYNITIAFVNSSDNSIVAVNAFEITFKLGVAYGKFNWFVNFVPKEVDSFENLTGSNQSIVIALVPPSLADETGVIMEDNVIFIKGTTNENLDRSTMKFIMAALNITV